MKRIAVGLVTFLAASSLLALQTGGQQSTPRKSNINPQSLPLNGRVFAITEGGDLKPGRLAKVYLLWNEPILNSKGIPSEQSAPGLTFLSKHLEEMKAASKEMDKLPRDISAEAFESLQCERELRGIDSALLATLESPNNGLQSGLVYLADADEEGNFRFLQIKPGHYLVLARGRAGANDVYWEQEVSLQPKEVGTVKLASVQKSCLDLQ